jgi:hypothetical protein
MTPDMMMHCIRCGHNLFKIIVTGAERDKGTLLIDVECNNCGDVFHPDSPFNRVPRKYFREVERP